MTTTSEYPIVLMVDDEPSLRQLWRVEADALGRPVHTTSNIESTMRFIKDRPRDYMFVYLDYELQRQSENGVELLRRIQEEASDRVIARLWTGKLTAVVEQEALDAGAYDAWDKAHYPFERVMRYSTYNCQHLKRLMAATTDFLTGLLNLRSFRESCIRAFSGAMKEAELPQDRRRHPEVFTMLCVDMDRFKRVNDTHGHTVGNLAIQTVGHILDGHVRDLDIVCRFGGDEFVILLPGVATQKDIEGVKENLKRWVAEAVVFDLEGDRVQLAASVGSASITRADINSPESNFDELLINADLALKDAKGPR